MNDNNNTGKPTLSHAFWLMVVTMLVIAGMLLLGCKRKAHDFATVTRGIAIERTDSAPASGTIDISADQPAPGPKAAEAEDFQPMEEAKGLPKDQVYAIKQGPRYHDRIHINRIGRLREVFNDSNKYQYAEAERLGIEPLTSLAGAYYTSRPIVHVKSNEFYTLDTLKHSLPFLVPEAERLLHDIGRNFIDSLGRRGADGYRIRVTSLLRTPHTVKRLRRVNRNAVDSSTHQFGTTFDISFVRFHCLDSTRTIHEEDLKNLLGEVLLDMRSQDRCLVKYEAKGGCFHITAKGKAK